MGHLGEGGGDRMVAHGDRAEVTAGKGTGWATVEVTAGKEVSMGCQGGRRGVCGNADMECGVSVGLSGWNRGLHWVLEKEEGCPWRSSSARRVSMGVVVGRRGCLCGNWGVLGDVSREARLSMEKQGCLWGVCGVAGVSVGYQ